MAQQHNVLISSGGRRVALANCFRQSLERYAPGGWVGTIDSGSTAPLSFCADRAWRGPRCTDAGFIDAVLDVCRRHSVSLVVPTIDTELPVYAANRERFAREGISVGISDPRTVAIACDKAETHAWLVANGFPTVRQGSVRDVSQSGAGWDWPLIVKPRRGSASAGIRIIGSPAELDSLNDASTEYVVQEIARGREFTANIYVDRAGNCIAAVPHWRIEVRGGEVSKAITFKHPEVLSVARRIAAALPGAYGALNVQGFFDPHAGVRIIEINARFGGGYPLAHAAGARFSDWLVLEMLGTRLVSFDGWNDDLAMLRFDDAVFVPGAGIRT